MGPAVLASSLAIYSSSCEQGRGKATLTPLLPYSYALGLPSAHHLWPVPTFGQVTENHLFTLALQGKDVPLRRVVRGLVTLALAGQAVVLSLRQILPPRGLSLLSCQPGTLDGIIRKDTRISHLSNLYLLLAPGQRAKGRGKQVT